MHRTIRMCRRGLWLLAAGWLFAGLADCGDNNNCTTDADAIWQSAGLGFTRQEPRRCPYVVYSANDTLPMALQVQAPTNDYNGLEAWADVYDAANQHESTVTDAPFYVNQVPYVETDDCPSGASLCSDIDGYFVAATTIPVWDSAQIGSDLPNSAAVALAWAIMPGRIDSSKYVMGGPYQVTPGYSASWNSAVSNDTASYLYQWLQDGNPIVGATGNGYAATFYQGQYLLGVIYTRSDYTADTAYKLVTVKLLGSLDGPLGVRPNYACTWSASVSGGDPPYSYEWYLDGALVGTDDSWSDYLSAGGHSLQLVIGDAANQTVSQTIGVTVDDTQPSCTI